MSWTVKFSGPGKRDLKRLDEQNRTRVRDAVNRLAETDGGDVKRLTNVTPPEWRLRVGDWRVRLTYLTKENVLMVLRVLPRGKAYDR